MNTVKIKLIGVSDLLQHNVRTVDTFDDYTVAMAEAVKAFKSKKTKANADAMYKAEWLAGLYHSDTEPYADVEHGPYVPVTWILKSCRDAAALTKRGKDIERGVVPLAQKLSLRYNGPRDLEGMWEARMWDRRPVTVGQAKTIRTRPKFRNWSVEAEFLLAPDIIETDMFIQHLTNAGLYNGIGDGRRGLNFGRFTVEVK